MHDEKTSSQNSRPQGGVFRKAGRFLSWPVRYPARVTVDTARSYWNSPLFGPGGIKAMFAAIGGLFTPRESDRAETWKEMRLRTGVTNRDLDKTARVLRGQAWVYSFAIVAGLAGVGYAWYQAFLLVGLTGVAILAPVFVRWVHVNYRLWQMARRSIDPFEDFIADPQGWVQFLHGVRPFERKGSAS